MIRLEEHDFVYANELRRDLMRFLLYAEQFGVEPTLWVSHAYSPQQPLMSSIYWEKHKLIINAHAIEALSPPLLAIVAARNYLGKPIWANVHGRLTMLTGAILIASYALGSLLGRYISGELLREIAHLVLVPLIHAIWSHRRERIENAIDTEFMKRINEPHLLLEAYESMITYEQQNGVAEKHLKHLVERANALRQKVGLPPREAVKPTTSPEVWETAEDE